MRGLLLLLNMTGIPRLVTRLMLDGRVPFRAKLIPPAALLYLISPIDIVPDAFLIRGWIDDILVLIISLATFLGMAPKEVVAEHLGRGKSGGKNADPGPTVIEGSYRIEDDEEQPKG